MACPLAQLFIGHRLIALDCNGLRFAHHRELPCDIFVTGLSCRETYQSERGRPLRRLQPRESVGVCAEGEAGARVALLLYYDRASQSEEEVVKALVNLKSLKTYTKYARQHGRRFITQWVKESRKPIPLAPYRPVPASWSDDQLTLAWIGHATVLINFYGTWLLTDPALRPHIGVSLAGVTFGPRRLIQPALAIRELPPLDAVLVSHAHMDHCDLGTLKRLPRQTAAVMQSGNRDLARRFRRVSELSWGESVEINGARIEAIEVNHWGARRLTDRHRGYGGFLITKNDRALREAGA